MRILTNYFNTLYNNTKIRQNQDQAGITASESAKYNYDAVTIRSTSPEALDSKFASALNARIKGELQQPTSAEKLEDLKSRIENGTYQVDANKIAERILLYKGADFHE